MSVTVYELTFAWDGFLKLCPNTDDLALYYWDHQHDLCDLWRIEQRRRYLEMCAGTSEYYEEEL